MIGRSFRGMQSIPKMCTKQCSSRPSQFLSFPHTRKQLLHTSPVYHNSLKRSAVKVAKYGIFATGLLVSSAALSMIGFFIYDATTYKTDTKCDTIQVPQLAISPETGGPENLPILSTSLDSLDTNDKAVIAVNKPKLVILGSGWASVGILKSLRPGDYDVTVISPTNYFLFTPLLPSAATSTLEVKSLMASIRSIVKKISGHYLEASAEKIEFADKLVKVTSNYDTKDSFYVPYDKLVIAVGCTANTHGVEGLEHCERLKYARDVIAIRKKIKDNLERACLPTTSDQERQQLLSFVICGGGATGTEFAAEISDLLNEDLPEQYPKILRQEASVHIIQSRSNILNTYDERISEYATKKFLKDDIDVQINSRVEKILPDKVIFKQMNAETGEYDMKELPFGLCLWSTGIAQNPLAHSVVETLGPYFQKNKRAIETDSHLRVIGCKDVYAVGDCSTVRTDLADYAVEEVKNFIIHKHHPNAKWSNHKDFPDEEIEKMSLTYEDICQFGTGLMKKFPQAREHLITLEEVLPDYDINNTGQLSYSDTVKLLKDVESKVTTLPATAQRAHQQGKYLGKNFSKLSKKMEALDKESENTIASGTTLVPTTTTFPLSDEEYAKPFKYVHLGSLAYIGNSAIFDMPGYSFVGGIVAMYLWRGIYFAQTVSLRTRLLLCMDWMKRGLFGRSIVNED